jgi:hypothetical protein
MLKSRLSAAMLLLAVLSLAVHSGCGPSRPQTVPVSGKVTYGGGNWPAKGTIYFLANKAAPGFPLRPGQAEFQPDGSFTAQTFDGVAGLMPGTYSIRIDCWEVPPSMEGRPSKSFLAASMADGVVKEQGAPKELVIAPGDPPQTLILDVPKRDGGGLETPASR